MIIRPLRDEERPAAVAMIAAMLRDEFAFAFEDGEFADMAVGGAYYAAPGCGLWCAEEDGRLVGTIALKAFSDHQASLKRMFVTADRRGAIHGVGQALVDHLSVAARQAGLRDIYLGTGEQFLAARRFYERNGFVRLAEGDLPPDFPKMAGDTVFFRCRLKVN